MDFYLRQLQPAAEAPTALDAPAASPTQRSRQPQRRLSAASKNRRLAQLQRLLDSGDYFSDDAMRARQPLLHHHYVAQVCWDRGFGTQVDIYDSQGSAQGQGHRESHREVHVRVRDAVACLCRPRIDGARQQRFVRSRTALLQTRTRSGAS